MVITGVTGMEEVEEEEQKVDILQIQLLMEVMV